METQPIDLTAEHVAQAAQEQVHELTTQLTQMRAAVIALQAQLATKQAELDGLRAEKGATDAQDS